MGYSWQNPIFQIHRRVLQSKLDDMFKPVAAHTLYSDRINTAACKLRRAGIAVGARRTCLLVKDFVIVPSRK